MRRRRYGMPARGKAFLFLLFLVFLLLLYNMQLRPVIESITANEAKIKSVDTINSAVISEMEKNPVPYSDLISVKQGGDGKVLAITTDVVKMNLLKAQMIATVQKNLSSDTHSTVWVPLGTLFGGDIFHGCGPSVPLKVTLSGNVAADFKSSFEAAGVNQTKHQIYLNVHTSVYSFLPGFDATTDVDTNVLVAETVIVGAVPQVMADFK